MADNLKNELNPSDIEFVGLYDKFMLCVHANQHNNAEHKVSKNDAVYVLPRGSTFRAIKQYIPWLKTTKNPQPIHIPEWIVQEIFVGAISYINHKTREVVLVITNTVSLYYTQKYDEKQKESALAHTITKSIAKYAKEHNYKLSVIGHKTAGWLAHMALHHTCNTNRTLCSKTIKPESIGIDNPGHLRVALAYGEHASRVKSSNYVTSTSLISSYGGHVGHTYKIEGCSGGLEYIQDCFNTTTHMPFNITKIKHRTFFEYNQDVSRHLFSTFILSVGSWWAWRNPELQKLAIGGCGVAIERILSAAYVWTSVSSDTSYIDIIKSQQSSLYFVVESICTYYEKLDIIAFDINTGFIHMFRWFNQPKASTEIISLNPYRDVLNSKGSDVDLFLENLASGVRESQDRDYDITASSIYKNLLLSRYFDDSKIEKLHHVFKLCYIYKAMNEKMVIEIQDTKNYNVSLARTDIASLLDERIIELVRGEHLVLKQTMKPYPFHKAVSFGQDILSKMHVALNANNATAIISGMEGSGRRTLAKEYAKKYILNKQNGTVVWFGDRSVNGIDESYYAFADSLALDIHSDDLMNQVNSALLRSHQKEILFVFDGADADVVRYTEGLPQHIQHIFIVRDSAYFRHKQNKRYTIFEMPEFTVSQAAKLFENPLHLGLPAGDAMILAKGVIRRPWHLVNEVISFLKEKNMPVTKFLAKIYPGKAEGVFAMIYNCIMDANPRAIELLNHILVLDTTIPRELLKFLDDIEDEIDALKECRVISVLENGSPIFIDSTTQSIAIAYLEKKGVITNDIKKQIITQLSNSIVSVFPLVNRNKSNIGDAKQYLPHALNVANQAKTLQINTKNVSLLFELIGTYHLMSGVVFNLKDGIDWLINAQNMNNIILGEVISIESIRVTSKIGLAYRHLYYFETTSVIFGPAGEKLRKFGFLGQDFANFKNVNISDSSVDNTIGKLEKSNIYFNRSAEALKKVISQCQDYKGYMPVFHDTMSYMCDKNINMKSKKVASEIIRIETDINCTIQVLDIRYAITNKCSEISFIENGIADGLVSSAKSHFKMQHIDAQRSKYHLDAGVRYLGWHTKLHIKQILEDQNIFKISFQTQDVYKSFVTACKDITYNFKEFSSICQEILCRIPSYVDMCSAIEALRPYEEDVVGEQTQYNEDL